MITIPEKVLKIGPILLSVLDEMQHKTTEIINNVMTVNVPIPTPKIKVVMF